MIHPNPIHRVRRRKREAQIGLLIARHGFGYLTGRFNPYTKWKLKRQAVTAAEQTAHIARSVRFRRMLEALGPTFIKLGQVLSTRPDILPVDIVHELTKLQDAVTPMPWEKVKKGLEHQLGDNFEQNFSEFATDPIASASIAQVYKARLKTGEEVAVKIIRPGTERTIRDDLSILERWLPRLLQLTLGDDSRRWNPHAIIHQLRISIQFELDLQHEGRNADIFRANFKGDKRVYVPRIYWDYTNRSVLVMEYINGKPLAEFFAEGVAAETKKALAQNGANIVLKQVFEHGFFQADPHPGNALVLDGGVICFLDFGMFGRLDPQSQSILGRVLHAVAKKDMNRLFKAARDLRVLPTDGDSTEMRLAVLDLLEQYYGLPLKQINIRQLLRDVIQLISRYQVGIRHDFLFLAKALSTIEATGRNLDPDFDMISLIEPFVRKLVARRFSPRHVLHDTQLFTEDVVQLTQETPELLLEILRQIRSGRSRLEFHHTGLENTLERMNRIFDKVTLGLIIGALLIASSLMAHAKLGPEWLGYPIIGGFGFLIAGGFGLYLVYDILRSRRS